MGMVGRSRRNGANQRVAATRILAVACEPSGIHDAVQELFATWNSAADAAYEESQTAKGKFARWVSSGRLPSSRHFSVLRRLNNLMVTYGVTATRVAEKGFNPADRGWLALIEPSGERDEDGRALIAVKLARWVVNDDGFIWNGDRYVQMMDGFVAGLDGRYVSDPVNPEDVNSVHLA